MTSITLTLLTAANMIYCYNLWHGHLILLICIVVAVGHNVLSIAFVFAIYIVGPKGRTYM